MDLSTHRISVKSVQAAARDQGITSHSDLARKAAISYMTARRYWNNDPMLLNFESRVVIKLCHVLKLDIKDFFEVIHRNEH